MPAAALVIAWWLDRSRQQLIDSPELALANERQSAPRVLGGLRALLRSRRNPFFWWAA